MKKIPIVWVCTKCQRIFFGAHTTKEDQLCYCGGILEKAEQFPTEEALETEEGVALIMEINPIPGVDRSNPLFGGGN